MGNGSTLFSVSRNKKKDEKESTSGKIHVTSRVEKEYMKPAYSASIGDEVEDGLFDGNLPDSCHYQTMEWFIPKANKKLKHMICSLYYFE